VEPLRASNPTLSLHYLFAASSLCRFIASRACNALCWSGSVSRASWTNEGLLLLLFYGMTTEEVDRIAGNIREFFGYGAAI
jgi:hypothetical protein